MLKPILKKIAETVLINTPYFGRRFEQMLKAYRSSAYPPGHYHSTIPSLEEVKQMLRNNEIIQSMHVTALINALRKLGEIQF